MDGSTIQALQDIKQKRLSNSPTAACKDLLKIRNNANCMQLCCRNFLISTRKGPTRSRSQPYRIIENLFADTKSAEDEVTSHKALMKLKTGTGRVPDRSAYADWSPVGDDLTTWDGRVKSFSGPCRNSRDDMAPASSVVNV